MSSIYSLNTISYKPLHTLEEVSVNKSRPRNTFEAMKEENVNQIINHILKEVVSNNENNE